MDSSTQDCLINPKKYCGAVSLRGGSFFAAEQRVLGSRRSATELRRQLRLGFAPRRTEVIFGHNSDEAGLIGEARRNVGRPPARPAFTGGGQGVPGSRRSATELGRQLRLSFAPRRTAVTFVPTFDEAILIGEERRNVGRPPARPAFTGGGRRIQ